MTSSAHVAWRQSSFLPIKRIKLTSFCQENYKNNSVKMPESPNIESFTTWIQSLHFQLVKYHLFFFIYIVVDDEIKRFACDIHGVRVGQSSVTTPVPVKSSLWRSSLSHLHIIQSESIVPLSPCATRNGDKEPVNWWEPVVVIAFKI